MYRAPSSLRKARLPLAENRFGRERTTWSVAMAGGHELIIIFVFPLSSLSLSYSGHETNNQMDPVTGHAARENETRLFPQVRRIPLVQRMGPHGSTLRQQVICPTLLFFYVHCL